MIFIDRKKVKAPESLTAKNSKGKEERTIAIKHFSKAKPKGKFEFTAYKQLDIKETLIKLFNGKCAYCESKILHVYPGDVEHFRPKSVIKYPREDKIKEIRPGYYWLAADWDNLLLAIVVRLNSGLKMLQLFTVKGYRLKIYCFKSGGSYPCFFMLQKQRRHCAFFSMLCNCL